MIASKRIKDRNKLERKWKTVLYTLKNYQTWLKAVKDLNKGDGPCSWF